MTEWEALAEAARVRDVALGAEIDRLRPLALGRQWTAPEAGWYELAAGEEPRKLTEAEVIALMCEEMSAGRVIQVMPGSEPEPGHANRPPGRTCR